MPLHHAGEQVSARRLLTLLQWPFVADTLRTTVHGNANTPFPEHPFIGLTEVERIDQDLQDYGFENTKLPKITPVLGFPRRKLPEKGVVVQKLMALMLNKIFHLREYFLPEVKNLIWDGVDRDKRSKSELAMLAEAANPKGLLTVSHGAQDCICLLYTSPSPRDGLLSRMPSSA